MPRRQRSAAVIATPQSAELTPRQLNARLRRDERELVAAARNFQRRMNEAMRAWARLQEATAWVAESRRESRR